MKVPMNISVNKTEDELDDGNEEFPLVIKVIYSIAIPIMVILCITGNILTITAFIQDRRLRTIHNTYLISLATADLLVGAVTMPFHAVYTLMSNTWPFGKAICKIFLSIDFPVCLESVLVIILVSYDRCMLLKLGAAYSAKQTLRAAKIRILLSWSLAFVSYVPAIIAWDMVRGFSIVEPDDCEVEFYDSFVLVMVTSCLEFVLPLISVASLNIYIYVLIRKHSRNKPGQNVSGNLTASSRKVTRQQNTTTTTTSQTPPTEDNDSSTQNRDIKRERKAARSLAILVCVFTICWLPYTTCRVVAAVCEGCVSRDLYEAFVWLLRANSSVNPFLYAFTNKMFRNNFIRILRIEKVCCPPSRIGPNDHPIQASTETQSNNIIGISTRTQTLN